MIERLIELGFTSAEIAGRQRERLIMRALHPVRGWMYEKFAEGNLAALEVWAAAANRDDRNSSLIGDGA